MGRLPGSRLPRRRRGVHPEPRPQAAGPLLPGVAAGLASESAGSLHPRRRGRHRGPRWARLRLAAAADSPGGLAGEAARGPDPRQLRGLGSARLRRPGPARRSAGGTPPAARGCAARRRAADPLDAGDARPGDRRRLVPPLRGRGPGRRCGQTARGPVYAWQAGLGQDQARPNRGLRRRRLPLAQERTGDDGRLIAARPFRRRG